MSLTDLAWVSVARDDVAVAGGVLGEARVNRLRYLEGAPKGSTRWLDTGWAIAAWAAAGERARRRDASPDFPLARKWGFTMKMDLGAFRTLFDKFVP